MEQRFYVVEVTTNSTGTETRKLTPYDNSETAYRKFFEIMTGIGGGALKICALLLDENLNQIKKEVWVKYIEPEPEPEPTPEPEEENPEETPSES